MTNNYVAYLHKNRASIIDVALKIGEKTGLSVTVSKYSINIGRLNIMLVEHNIIWRERIMGMRFRKILIDGVILPKSDFTPLLIRVKHRDDVVAIAGKEHLYELVYNLVYLTETTQ